MQNQPWSLHPDRALPADPTTRSIARTILDEIENMPIVSMHGHVDVKAFRNNTHFGDPASLIVIPDHYLVRMLVSQGIPHSALGVKRKDGGEVETDPRKIWRTFAENWHLFRGTPTRFWLEHVFVEVLGIKEPLSAQTADAAYDQIQAVLDEPNFRPLELLDKFDIEIIGTTDPANSTLEDHQGLAQMGWGERVVPTFRPDSLLHVNNSTWRGEIDDLSQLSGIDATTYAGFISALEQRRQAFIAAGARATDHGHLLADTTPLSDEEATRIFASAMRGEVSDEEAQAFSGHMLFQMARMSAEDGLVMQLHPGSMRNYDSRTYRQRGADVGYDIPIAAEYTRSLQPVLENFGHHPNFRFLVFTLDEDVYSRELAPLAGVYPSMKLGAPWWFLDTRSGMLRFRELVTDTAGFYNTSGFVDDTRAYLSIPARHNLSRRVDASFLAGLVAQHELGLDEAVEVAKDLTYNIPMNAYPKPQSA